MAFKMEVEMVDYDQVRDRGCISFISSKGNPLSIWINQPTFEKLMVGPWDINRYGEPNLYQKELRDSLRKKLRGGYRSWFETNANRHMRDKTRSGGTGGGVSRAGGT
jgi:hypothetical protein